MILMRENGIPLSWFILEFPLKFSHMKLWPFFLKDLTFFYKKKEFNKTLIFFKYI